MKSASLQNANLAQLSQWELYRTTPNRHQVFLVRPKSLFGLRRIISRIVQRKLQKAKEETIC